MPDIVSGGITAIVICVVSFCIQFGIFVRPEQLEKKHREILEACETKFAALSTVNDLKQQLQDVKCTTQKIYDLLVEGHKI